FHVVLRPGEKPQCCVSHFLVSQALKGQESTNLVLFLATSGTELIFQMLDINGDGMLDFNEYLLLLFNSAKACYRHLQKRPSEPRV
uniref:EF-hand domain-containing protein n=1 Tax=Varanus komodoensis TaxID=61221 RepID=A0A8D2JGR7_VARKO